jgi:N-acetylglucosaminyldiphosphoundecaprenol N-acetyl-beta-D-mannosaminyltransferase
MLGKTYILDVGITNESEDKILEYLLLGLEKYTQKYYIVTPNPEILVYSYGHPSYKKILNEAKIALPDGVGVFLASALMGYPLEERITGIDFMEEICKRSYEQPLRMGFLGGRGGVAEKTAECLKAKYPWIEVVFVGEEWEGGMFARGPAARLHLFQIDILFVAFGYPKQEEWIYNNLEKLPVRVAMGVGGAFDYISGEVIRAPFIIRAVGLEWFFRLIRQPWRWRRQMALGKFVWLVLKEWFKKK